MAVPAAAADDNGIMMTLKTSTMRWLIGQILGSRAWRENGQI